MKYLIILLQFTILTSAIAQGIEIDSAKGINEDAIRINYASDAGVSIGQVGRIGVYVDDAGLDGIHVGKADRFGVYVGEAVSSGIYVEKAGSSGINIDDAGGDGIYIYEAGGNGVHIDDVDIDGVHVEYANNDGIYVENAKFFSMNIQGSKSLSGGPEAHIAQIYNRNTVGGADVLALKIGQTDNPTQSNNFITFYRGADVPVGKIQGNGAGGIEFGTMGADFAECLTPVSEDQNIEAGDIVGVHAGKISLHTQDAAGVMVITDRPAVLGNQNEDSEDDEKVSFIGQVLVNVRGEVHAGDWIVASGDEDGTGIAVPSSEITLDHKIVGKAWESNQDLEVKKVNTAVGLDHSEAKDAIIRNMESKMTDLQSQIDELKRLITKG